ncbi:MAG: type 1 glutamine amidotransferase [Candidatus Aminicenantes bacterium]|nr:type 1 glutamine amidotransferase [Candidatus Aminicenantes bacterium]
MTATKRIAGAIVDNSVIPEIYRPVEHWSRHLDVPWQAFTAREGSLPDPAAFSHIILTGSEASILEREPWVDAEAAMVREAVAAGPAVLGSCWGHQLIAFALAGDGHVRRAARPEIGWIPIRLERSSALLGPAGTSAFTFSSHYDEVFDLPAGFGVLASSEGCAVQAFRVGDKPVWGLQCHPEIDVPTGQQFIRDLIGRGFKGREALLEAQAQPPRDSGLIRGIVRAFLDA